MVNPTFNWLLTVALGGISHAAFLVAGYKPGGLRERGAKLPTGGLKVRGYIKEAVFFVF